MYALRGQVGERGERKMLALGESGSNSQKLIKDQCKRMKKRRTAVTDLSRDELSSIFIIMAQSGAAEIARLMSVCRLFSEVGKSEDILRALNFDGFEVSIESIKNYQQINGLIRLAAEAGHSAAPYMFGKIIILCCSNLSRPTNFSNLDPRPEKWIYTHGTYLSLDIFEGRKFMSQLISKSSCNGKGLYHYRFVKMFLTQFGPYEFIMLCYHLNCYLSYCQKVSCKSKGSLRYSWDLRENHGRKSVIFIAVRMYAFRSRHDYAEFEEFRSRILQDLDDIFILNI
ncbi:hypothetical protein QQ045_022307 [Rhodiola kirilowii]